VPPPSPSSPRTRWWRPTRPPGACSAAGRFASGVASGDPTPRGITLWTHVAEASGKGGVRLEIARDRDFRRVLTSKVIQTRPGIDHTVKARVGGLRADERYYYRFETATRESPVGRFQTALPRRLGAAGQARVLLAARTSRTATTTRTS
jgi:alkaline phosphatase D